MYLWGWYWRTKVVKNTVYQFVGSNLGLRCFWKRGNIRKRVCWNRRLRLLFKLCIRILRRFYLHLCFKLKYYIQNGAKCLHKLTPGFKNHLRNLGNFRQALESPKSWTLMGYFCPKNTFFQLEHYIPEIYPTLLSTTCVKIHQITCHFWNHI